MPPEETLKRLGLRSGDVFVDIGCGIGYFSIPALDIVGSKGRVYAVDTVEVMLDKLRNRIEGELPDNLVLINSGEYSLGVEAETATFVFMSNVLHEVDDRGLFIDKLREILVENGKLAIIDWVKKESDFGPPREHPSGCQNQPAAASNGGGGGRAVRVLSS